MSTDVHVHVHQQDRDVILEEIARLKSELLTQLERLIQMDQETKDILDQINAFTNQMATELAAQGPKLAEIGSDLDALIASTSDPELKARLTLHRDVLATIASETALKSETLTQLAAKHEAPIPAPPVG